MKDPDNCKISRDRIDYRGWHGPMPRIPPLPMPDPGLDWLGRMRWHIREYFRPKSAHERLMIRLARRQQD